MNVTLTAATNNAFTVTGVETINVNFSQVAAGDFVATNITKATAINLSSDKFGFTGDAQITSGTTTGVSANVTAGTGITGKLTVQNAHANTIDVGSAATLVVDALTAGTSTLTVKANGNLNLGLVTDKFKSVTINATKDASVDLITTAGGTSILQDAMTITLVASLGAGDDIVKLNAGQTAGSLVIDGGDGTDTITLTADTTDLSSATVTLANVEKFLYKDGVAGATTAGVTLNGSVLNGKTYTLAADDNLDTITYTVKADKAALDLSTINRHPRHQGGYGRRC